MKLAVIIPCHNRKQTTLAFLDKFSVPSPHQIVIVDDGSQDGTSAAITDHFPKIKVILGNGDLWWTGATNLGVQWALENNFTHVLTINDDAQIQSDYPDILLDRIEKHPDSIIGSRIMRGDLKDKVWAFGASAPFTARRLWQLGHENTVWESVAENFSDLTPCQALCGNGTVIPISCFKKIGAYDQKKFPHYHADGDFTLRATRAGWKCTACSSLVLWNQINEPLPRSRWQTLFSKKSPLYLPALAHLIIRHCPRNPPWRPFVVLLGHVLPPMLFLKKNNSLGQFR